MGKFPSQDLRIRRWRGSEVELQRPVIFRIYRVAHMAHPIARRPAMPAPADGELAGKNLDRGSAHGLECRCLIEFDRFRCADPRSGPSTLVRVNFIVVCSVKSQGCGLPA